MEEIDELDELLLAAAADGHTNQKICANDKTTTESSQQLKETDTFAKHLELNSSTNGFSNRLNRSLTTIATASLIVSNAHDSSDDEDVSNFLERKYNEYGQDIQSMLRQSAIENKDKQITRKIDKCLNEAKESWTSQPKIHKFPDYKPPIQQASAIKLDNAGIYTDPVFGIRIIHPLISSSVLQERMVGRTAISMAGLSKHLLQTNLEDWAFAGVLLSKVRSTTILKKQLFLTANCYKRSNVFK